MPNKERLAKETSEQREKRLNYQREYNRINKDRINQMMRENELNFMRDIKYICECGLQTSKHRKSEHIKSQRHLNLLIEKQASTIVKSN